MALKRKVDVSIEELASAATWPLVQPSQLSPAFFPLTFLISASSTGGGTLNLFSPPARHKTPAHKPNFHFFPVLLLSFGSFDFLKLACSQAEPGPAFALAPLHAGALCGYLERLN